jgi:arginine decarboxylase
MKNRYLDLIEQTFYFPQEEFVVEKGELNFHKIPLMDVIKKYGTPLKFTYLPKISQNIQRAKGWFNSAILKHNYEGKYNFSYCSKSSHFSFVMNEALKNNIHLETSSAFDINIVEKLFTDEKITKDQFILCNGYKPKLYQSNVARLLNNGFKNVIPIIDGYGELESLSEQVKKPFNIGIRIASEEEPKFTFYTSRLGIGYTDLVPYYRDYVADNPKVKLKMLHFFVNTGIRDTAYYWSELTKCLRVYCQLKKVCPDLDSLNIGGGFPIKNSLAFEYDYQYMADQIVLQIQTTCNEFGVPTPDIFTEFGSFTVGESGGVLFSVIDQKKQNDRETWNLIDSSFMTNLPDSWAINKRFIMLPINRWNERYERVLLGGLTCDSDDFYNSEQHINAIYLPRYKEDATMYLGFFNTGAYQESLSGYGGIKHCLIPSPKHLLIDRDEKGKLKYKLFAQEQNHKSMLKILGYQV